MSALTRFERLDDLFPELMRRFARLPAMEGELPGDIRIDVTENEKDYVVRAEVPGAKKDDIRVVVDGQRVSISAEVKREREQKSDKEGRVLLRETSWGQTSRSFTLAHEVDSATATAKLDDGVLTLTLPKRSGASSKLVAIE